MRGRHAVEAEARFGIKIFDYLLLPSLNVLALSIH